MNIARGEFFNALNVTKITLNNFTVVSNIGNFPDEGVQSLFSFYSPIKPLQVILNNSLFENNVLGNNVSLFCFNN